MLGKVAKNFVHTILTVDAPDTPQGLAVDTAGNVYVADTNNHTIRIGAPAQP